MITVKDLVKEYRVRKNYGGFKGLFSRDYNTIRAVDGLSFDVSGGEIVGFIGPNGAGKSTTMVLALGEQHVFKYWYTAYTARLRRFLLPVTAARRIYGSGYVREQ